MGAFTSRRNAGVEEVDISTGNAYRYPPKSGCYFGSHFFMGGERFETTQPEAYLFGENQDLNFLGNRPMPFPYPAPQAHEPTKTLKSLVNIRKDSLKFIKVSDEEGGKEKQVSEDGDTEGAPEPPPCTRYNVEFTVDTDVKCAITIYYFATEEISNKQAIYHPRDATMNSETFHYKRGANQQFCQSTHIIDPSRFPEEEWQYNPDKDVIPIVIQCVVEEEEHIGHSHMTFAIVEKSPDSSYALKPLKQKQMVDGLCYLLQEIYGIENKNVDRAKPADDDLEDSGSECAICLVETRDTLILPCRHLCLCNGCADSLRYQASNCPICRAPFRALLQIRAMRKKQPALPQAQLPVGDAEENPLSQEGVPAGYEAVSLIEALNGPNATPPPANPTVPHTYPDGENPELDKLLGYDPGDEGKKKKRSSQRSSSGRRRGLEGVVLASSLPTSPEESPMMERRKIKRQLSGGSARQRQSLRGLTGTGPKVEEASEATEQDLEAANPSPEENTRVGTPEVVMTDIAADPAKSPSSPQKFAMPRVRYPQSMLPSPSEEVKVIDETQRQENLGDPDDIYEEMVDPAPSPPPDYEEIEPTSVFEDLDLRPAAHTTVLFNQQEADKEIGGGDGEACLATHVLEPMLPGSCGIADASGSSYGSTNSNKELLGDGPKGDVEPDDPDDKPIV